MASDLPCDADGACMMCKSAPPEAEVVLCRTCATPWHVQCLSKPPETHASVAEWECPDCSPTEDLPAAAVAPGGGSSVPSGASADLIASIRAIEADGSLTEQEKAKRRQELVSGGAAQDAEEDGDKKRKGKAESDDVLDLLDEKFNCSFCMQLPDRPVTTPCGHNFCLKCFQKWVGQGKHTCAKCRAPIPSKMSSQPRINSALVVAIRMAKTAKSATSGGPAHVYHFMRNENRPEKAFTTERAKKAGKANACCGQIFVTVPPDHFGPILADNDPKRNQGVLVGESWEDRMECRQWGVHLPHVAGIAGQSEYGAQSVALSGGYEDDEDHGEWFLYTGSGGRDLSGNKRTNKDQSFDQKFEKYNEALRVSCKKGYPVRVVRSHKEKRSSYAPESGVRYDGIYRIEQCWRKVGIQGYKVCRYLFVRCDNEPAPWTSDEHGDRPRPLPAIKELKNATDITVRKDSPAWDYEEEHGWKWIKAPPVSRKPVITGNPDGKRARKAVRQAQNLSVRQRLLKEFSCLICRKVMTSPLTTPCAHHFCKPCLVGAFADQSFVRERTREGGRTLRAQKIVKKCPSCPTDISEFLQNPQVNREMMDLIETLQRKTEEENTDEPDEEGGDVVEKSSEDGLDDVEENKLNEDGDDKVDAMKLCAETGNGAEGMKLNDEESDGAKEKEAEDVDEAPNGNAVSSRTARKRVEAGKKAKNAEVTEMDEEGSGAEDQKAMDVAEDSEAVGVDSDKNGSKQEGRDQAKGAKPPAQFKRKGPAKKGGRVKKARTTDARDDGDDSPSSPLHVTADDDDFQ